MTPEAILQQGLEIIKKKQVDYATDPTKNRYENFERSGTIASWFKDPIDIAFATLIGTKLARLGSLLSENKTPNNETVEDTFIDLANYSALWGGYRTSVKNSVEDESDNVTKLSPCLSCSKCGSKSIPNKYMLTIQNDKNTVIRYNYFCSYFCMQEYIDKFLGSNKAPTYNTSNRTITIK